MFVIPYTTTSRANVAPRFGRAFDRLFDESLDRHFGRSASAPTARTPAMDVSESDTAYTVVLDVPGAAKDQLKVTVEGRRVSVETLVADPGTDAAPADAKAAERALYRERTAARYARTVVLPAEVDQASSQARFDNGVLTLTLAKRVPSGATQISID